MKDEQNVPTSKTSGATVPCGLSLPFPQSSSWLKSVNLRVMTLAGFSLDMGELESAELDCGELGSGDRAAL